MEGASPYYIVLMQTADRSIRKEEVTHEINPAKSDW